MSFGQNIKTKTIKVFVFGDVSYIKTQIPVFEADILIYIDGTIRETKKDKDGKEVVMFYISYDGRSGLNHANIFIPIEFANSVTVGKRIRLDKVVKW